MQIDPDAAEKLVVVRKDFLHALENDVKPAFGASEEVLQVNMINKLHLRVYESASPLIWFCLASVSKY